MITKIRIIFEKSQSPISGSEERSIYLYLAIVGVGKIPHLCTRKQ